MDASATAVAAMNQAAALSPQPRPVRGFVLDLLIALAVMLVASLVAGAGWAMVRGIQLGMQRGPQALPEDPAQLMQLIGPPGPLALLLIALVSTGSAALVAYAWRRRADRPDPLPATQAWRRRTTWGWALGAGAASFLLAQALTWLGAALDVELTPSNLAVLEPTAAQQPWLLLGFAVLIAPLYEELLFRRVLFGRMWRAGRPWLGLVLSSLAFALVHEPPGLGSNGLATTALLWVAYAGMGAAFAWVYWRTGSLWTAIGAHATNNLLAGLGLFVALG